MNRATKPQISLTFAGCLWLCLLAAGYMLLHTLYSFASLPAPSLLYFLPAIIYILGGLLMAKQCISSRLNKNVHVVWIVLGLSGVLLLLGCIFGVLGLHQLLLGKI